MIGFVFLSLLVLTVAFGCMMLLLFADVAFRGPQTGMAVAAGSLQTSLRHFDGAALALRLEQAVSRAVIGLGLQPASTATCDAACHGREIQVTTPEALAIAQELGQRHSPAQVNAIRMQAQRNLLVQNGTFHCPLLMSGGFCACDAARPVACRTRCVAGADSPAEAERLAESIGAGATDVFRDCLQASGLDDGRYNLNLALAQILNTPQAASRWAHGDRVLQTAPVTST
jgi:hypothetical protein